MLSVTKSATIIGVSAEIITVEADISNGLPSLEIVGLPNASVKESRYRVRSGMKNSGFDFPLKRITVNLAPADLRKEGSHFDLPIALSILEANGDIPLGSLERIMVVGELSLDGSVRGVAGILPMAMAARDGGLKGMILPSENLREAEILGDFPLIGVGSIGEAVLVINSSSDPFKSSAKPFGSTDCQWGGNGCHWAGNGAAGIDDIDGALKAFGDISDIIGQAEAKRALEITAAGGHSLLLIGPPGTGKSMLASRLPTILPPLTLEEALEVTKIYSVAGLIPRHSPLITVRPFRSPHHTITAPALIGGGSKASPGEISLAHHGVLFLDELGEFNKHLLDMLRQPIEDGHVYISRLGSSVKLPCRFTLVGAMNPCNCGYLGDPSGRCRCSEYEIARYRSKLSGPFLDRIDLQVEVAQATASGSGTGRYTSAEIRDRVVKAWRIQKERYSGSRTDCNARMTEEEAAKFIILSKECRRLFDRAAERSGISMRARSRILKVARSIADLDGRERIEEADIMEAVQYRALERKLRY